MWNRAVLISPVWICLPFSKWHSLCYSWHMALYIILYPINLSLSYLPLRKWYVCLGKIRDCYYWFSAPNTHAAQLNVVITKCTKLWIIGEAIKLFVFPCKGHKSNSLPITYLALDDEHRGFLLLNVGWAISLREIMILFYVDTTLVYSFWADTIRTYLPSHWYGKYS